MTDSTTEPNDAQSKAFREATDDDHWDGNIPEDWAILNPIESLEGIKLPDAYEAIGWDQDKDTPKTAQEANDALTFRIGDPQAPDDYEVMHIDYVQDVI